ncbi:lipid IV(A) 3-deoxy-D-manno-octulosonic acid transferase [Vibrio sp. 10N.261.51.F12]|uniref:lipid IV(A) 3-deoxy-D-manno-octulosonic acid transferase n=1 Tax=Vibrio sp. 10N.261.51.F12 TaxID=3229679 RepID=UPI003553BA78
MLRVLYSLLLALIAPLFLYGLYKKKPGKPSVGARWKEHFGVTPLLALRSNEAGGPLWIHAVSVGEVIAVSPLIKAIKQQHPSLVVVVTTTTPTGAEQAEKLGDLIHHRYMPLDFGFALRRYIRIIQPSQLLIMETELWPNTLHAAATAQIPVSILNARLSERSYQRYKKVNGVVRSMFSHLQHIYCQNSDDQIRFHNLGVPMSKITVTGSIKYDIQVDPMTRQHGRQLKELLGSRPVWAAASTHSGEDELIIEAHKALLVTHPNALLILIPRHPERFNQVFELCQQLGCDTVRRTQVHDSLPASSQVYLADTMGEMMIILGAADICFMGGSLLGDKVGGHNLLEPAALGVPTLIGPSYFNFNEITEVLTSRDATLVVSAPELAATLNQLFNHPQQLSVMRQASLEVVAENRGSIQTTIDRMYL